MESPQRLARQHLQTLLDRLRDSGFTVVGPTVRDGAVVMAPISSTDQLPTGWHDQQAPGQYRLEHDDSPRCFDWNSGPQAIKPHVFLSRETLWQVQHTDGGLAFSPPAGEVQPIAIIGARACDLAALALQDRHFLDQIEDPYYARRRRNLFIVAVHCGRSAPTCFCVSTGDGPRVVTGFDLALSELDDCFLIESGSEAGNDLLGQLPTTTADDDLLTRAEDEIEQARRAQSRRLPPGDLGDALLNRLDHPRWQQVADRCLSCGNCTSVCPTCFCHSEHDAPMLDGSGSSHVREWDSCFSEGHSYIHGIVIRDDTAKRYRQWLTHKLGTWHQQYGRSGCTGCGRCITWCPVGIDITVEVAAVLSDEVSGT